MVTDYTPVPVEFSWLSFNTSPKTGNRVHRWMSGEANLCSSPLIEYSWALKNELLTAWMSLKSLTVNKRSKTKSQSKWVLFHLYDSRSSRTNLACDRNLISGCLGPGLWHRLSTRGKLLGRGGEPCFTVVLIHLLKMIIPQDSIVLILLYVHCALIKSNRRVWNAKVLFQCLEWVTRDGFSSCSKQFPRETWSITSGLPFYNPALWMVWG